MYVLPRRYGTPTLVCADRPSGSGKPGFDRGPERRPIIVAVSDFGDAQSSLIAEGLADAVLRGRC